ncbi:uncharacterized protein DS421_15g514590 [Arachis hypogaea]|nr:uncharacterized protein DS421_15g514590 [Arachis hypogaea]
MEIWESPSIIIKPRRTQDCGREGCDAGARHEKEGARVLARGEGDAVVIAVAELPSPFLQNRHCWVAVKKGSAAATPLLLWLSRCSSRPWSSPAVLMMSRGSGRRRCRCRRRELHLCDSNRRGWSYDFRDRRRSFWPFLSLETLLPSPEKSPLPESGRRSRWRWLPGPPPNWFRDHCCFGSAALSLVRLSFGCCMLRLELLRLLRKWLGAEVLVAASSV